jgi:uncharacterized protein
MCDYCYEYNCGNTSWRKKPKEMSWEVYTKSVERIIEHMARHATNSCFFSFHGGEPLLRSPKFFADAATYAKGEFGKRNIEIGFGMQTNATLLTKEYAKILFDSSIGVGVSLDGPEEMHNEFRVYSNGDPTYTDVRAGLENLLTEEGRSIWDGFLTVINVRHDPLVVFDHLATFSPPSTDFLEPHGAWNKLPVGKDTPEDTTYGDWLIRLFDYWFYSDKASIPIRIFEEIIEHNYGGNGSVEYFGLQPVDLITIATDGAYESVDCVKAAHPEAENLGLNIFDHSLDEVLEHPMVNLRQIGLDALPQKCRQCDLVNICGGGYFAHRYSPENGFCNPSIYCADMKKLIRHIQNALPSVRSG